MERKDLFCWIDKEFAEQEQAVGLRQEEYRVLGHICVHYWFQKNFW
jgi:hypothetical protein